MYFRFIFAYDSFPKAAALLKHRIYHYDALSSLSVCLLLLPLWMHVDNAFNNILLCAVNSVMQY